MDSIDKLRADIGLCRRCSLGKDPKRIHPAYPYGAINSKVMIIGEAAGKEEEKRGLPFCGPAGQLLAELLKKAGFNPKSDIFLTNCCCCRPRSKEAGRENVPPTDEQIEACRPFLDRAIALVQPKVICPVGGSAIRRLFELDKIRVSDWVGQEQVYVDKKNREIPCVPNFHPAYLIRKGKGTKEYLELEEKMVDIFRVVKQFP